MKIVAQLGLDTTQRQTETLERQIEKEGEKELMVKNQEEKDKELMVKNEVGKETTL